MRTLFAIILTLCFLNIHAQSIVKGQLVNPEGVAVEFGNVLLYTTKDSTLVKGELTDIDGKYELNKIKAGTYYVEFSMIGYENFVSETFSFTEEASTKDLGTIQFNSQAANLETVTVTAKKPFLEQRAGKMVVNVEGSITGNNGSLQDLLKRVPGMVVVNGKLQMAGKPSVTILIDGQPTQYMDVQALLREMPADGIQKIEVISQPDASFDAAGTGGVINIVLKKNVMLGTNGSVRVGVGYGDLWKYNGSVRLNTRQGKWNLNSSVSFNHNTYQEGLSVGRQVQDRYFFQDNNEPEYPYTGTIRAGASYSLDDRQTVGVSGRYSKSSNETTGTSFSTIRKGGEEGELLQRFVTTNDKVRDWNYQSADAYYRFDIDTSGQKFKLAANVARYNRNSNSLIQSELLEGEPLGFRSTQNNEPGIVDIWAVNGDYTLPISKALQLKLGAKYSQAEIDSDLQASFLDNEEWQNDTGRSNHFIFSEKIMAAYTNLAYTTDKFDANIGLRFEDTESIGNSLSLDSVNVRNYRQLFPSLSINVPLNDHLGISGAYSYRIDRPRYSALNPFVYVMDPFTFEKGNPFLQPELTHSTKLSVTYDKQPFFNLEYNRTNNAIVFVTEQDDATGVAFGQEINLDRYDQIGGSLFFPLDFIHDRISGYGGALVYYNRYNSDYLGGLFEESRVSVTGFLQVNAKLAEGLNLEATGWYQGKGVEGIMTYEPLYGFSMGIEKKLLDDRATLSLSVDDLFYRNWYGNINYQNQQMDLVSTWETQIVNLKFSYSFGNQFLKKDKRERSSGAEENRRAQIK